MSETTNKVDKKQTSWELVGTTYKAIMPKGTVYEMDITKLFSPETWASLNEGQQFTVLYGIKQIVSDRSNMANNETERVTLMEKAYQRIIDGDLARTSGIKMSAKKELDSAKAKAMTMLDDDTMSDDVKEALRKVLGL